jgi:hypothetical protein
VIIYDHSQKGGFQITLIVLLSDRVNLCDCESQQNIGSVETSPPPLTSEGSGDG